jgi:hypothetical protein
MTATCQRCLLKILSRPPDGGRLLFSLAVRTGLEPATLGVTGRYSNQLNYRTILQRDAKLT